MDRKVLRIEATTLQDALKAAQRGNAGIRPCFAVLQSFERIAGEVYALRRQRPANDELRRFAEDLLASTSHELMILQGTDTHERREGFTLRYRRVWRAHASLFVYAVAVFIVSSLIGWAFTTVRPEYAPVLVPQPMMEVILDRQAWFERLAQSPVLGGLSIALNNIMVALKTFAGGALLGLGGVVLLIFNGLHLGAVFGFCAANNFGEPLSVFILAHGPLELSIIIAAGFLSMLYGRAFFMRPYRNFTRHLRYGAQDAFIGLCGVVPWLVLAAILEAFVSPFDTVPVSIRAGIGFVAAAAFWGWTLWPTPSTKKHSASLRRQGES